MPCYVFVPDDLEAAKILATETYGAKVVAVKGNYDDVNRLCAEVAESLPWAFVNVNMRPYYAEGSNPRLRDRRAARLAAPITSSFRSRAARSSRRSTARSRSDHDRRGRGEAVPGERCPARGLPSVAQAFQDGAEQVTPVKPDTIARSLAIGSPADGSFALEIARETGGAIEWCTGREILEGIELLASTEGVFTETAGGVTIANLKRLVDQGVIRPDEEVVAYVTGNGFKTVEAFEGRVEPSSTSRPISTSSSPRWPLASLPTDLRPPSRGFRLAARRVRERARPGTGEGEPDVLHEEQHARDQATSNGSATSRS